MSDVRRQISQSISNAVANLWGLNVVPELSVPDDFDFGDLSTNVAFKLAKELRKPPKAIAGEIAEVIELPKEIRSAEPAGAGYINFSYSVSFLREILEQIIAHPKDFGRGEPKKYGKIQIEYVSANPTGPLNVVSARAAAVGSSLVSILRYAGYI